MFPYKELPGTMQWKHKHIIVYSQYAFAKNVVCCVGTGVEIQIKI